MKASKLLNKIYNIISVGILSVVFGLGFILLTHFIGFDVWVSIGYSLFSTSLMGIYLYKYVELMECEKNV
jgi:hypothetical protein